MNTKYKLITNILSSLDRKEALQLIGEILDKEYNLATASNMVKQDCDSNLNKLMFDNMFYEEGNENEGYVGLRTILNAVEEIINCDDSISANIKFTCFVRPEDEDEKIENSHDGDDSVEWWTIDESVDIDNLYVHFEG